MKLHNNNYYIYICIGLHITSIQFNVCTHIATQNFSKWSPIPSITNMEGKINIACILSYTDNYLMIIIIIDPYNSV